MIYRNEGLHLRILKLNKKHKNVSPLRKKSPKRWKNEPKRFFSAKIRLARIFTRTETRGAISFNILKNKYGMKAEIDDAIASLTTQ